MERAELELGEKVRVIPKWYNKDLPKPPEHIMFVRELYNPLNAGLSHTVNGEHVYGIIYSVIHPLAEKN